MLSPNNSMMSIKTDTLESEDCILLSTIRSADSLELKYFDIDLLKDSIKPVHFSLSDLFISDYITVPSPNHTLLHYRYHTETCEDLKPLIKAISWKNPKVVSGEHFEVMEVLANILIKIHDGNGEFYLYHHNTISNTINLCSDEGFGIKYDVDRRRVFILNEDKISYLNFGNDTWGRRIFERLRSISEIFDCHE